MLIKWNIKITSAASIGVVLEFYDFAIFILLAPVITETFFKEISFSSQLITYSIFAIGYFVRPLGGMLMAHFGDKYGRKNVFSFSIIIMSIATFSIGILPGYKTIGILAPFLLVLCRALQGFSIGSESPGAVTFVYEHVENSKTATANSFIIASSSAAFCFSVIVVYILYAIFTDAFIMEFAWRIPFFIGGFIGLVGLYIRRKLTETPVFVNLKQKNRTAKIPIIKLITFYKKNTITTFFTYYAVCTVYCILYVFFPALLISDFHINPQITYKISFLSILWSCITILFWGRIADKLNLNLIKLNLFVLTASFFSISLLFITLTYNNFTYAMFFLFISSIFSGALTNTCLIPLKLFPPDIRFSGISFAYNIAVILGSGLSPVIITLFGNYFPKVYSIIILLFTVTSLCLLSLKYSAKSFPNIKKDFI